MQTPAPSFAPILEDNSAQARLSTLAKTLAAELQAMPDADTIALPAALQALSQEQADTASAQLCTQLDHYWSAASGQAIPRRQLLIDTLQQSLSDEVAIKVQAGALHLQYAGCVAEYATRFNSPQPDAYALRLRLSEFDSVALAGALVFSVNEGPTLLALPGYGVESFPSLEHLRSTLITTFNTPLLRSELLSNAEQRHQDALLDVERDVDLFVEPLQASDLILRPLVEPFAYAVDSQLNKQQEDIKYAFGEGRKRLEPGQSGSSLINAAIMKERFGPAAMLEQWAHHRRERLTHQQLPDWLKNAPAAELRNYLQSLEDYDRLRAVLASLMEGAASAEEFAQLRLRTRIASDLGYDLDPARLHISTQRRLPVTGETYQTRRSLSELALYGLHGGDLDAGSAFLLDSRFSLDDQPLGDAYPRLTAAYIGALVDELDLRSVFGDIQRHTYGNAQVVQLMRQVQHQLLIAEAHRARLQGHISPADFQTLERLGQADTRPASGQIKIQQVKLNERDVLSKTLLIRRLNADGSLARLILFTQDSPLEKTFHGFDSERQLLHELVGWSASDSLNRYLLEQVNPDRRKDLQSTLLKLREKPQPSASFLGFVSHISYSDALYAQTSAHIQVKIAEQFLHTPGWYLRASKAHRRELLALEDAIKGALDNYQAKPHTHVPDFEDYVHQRASEKINALLGLPAASVDPDKIIVTSPREQLTYTQMLRDGYDDSLGFFNAGAAEQATFSGPPGVDLTALTAQKVAGSVRGAWLSDGYIAHINSNLLAPTSEGYAYRRASSLLITQLQMQAAALRSLLKQEISAPQYAWLKTAIEALSRNDKDSRRRYPLDPLQLRVESPLIDSGDASLNNALEYIVEATRPVSGSRPKVYQVETVQGCHILSPDETRDPWQALLYTPDAPDGRAFRKLSDFANTLKRDGMSDYYKDRCRIKAGRTLAFMLIDLKKQADSQPPALPATPLANTLEVCFDRVLQRKIRNVEDTTVGRSDMLARQIWNGIELVAIAVTLPFPLASFTVGILLALRDSGQALQALNEGDRETAGYFVLSSLLNTLGAWGDLHSGIKFLGGPLRQLTGKTGQSPGLTMAKHLQASPKKGNALSPVTLHGEQFWAGKPGVRGHAPLFRAPPHDPEKLLATGRFTEQDLAGIWQPVHQPTPLAPPGTVGKANPSHAVQQSPSAGVLIDAGHAKGTRTLNGNHYVELQGQVFQVQYDGKMRLWHIVDPANPYAFFGRQPIRLGEDGNWLLIDRLNLSGGSPVKFAPLESASTTASTSASTSTATSPSLVPPLAHYEMPLKWRHIMDAIVDPELEALYRADPITGPTFTHLLAEGHQTYTLLREGLHDDAMKFFDSPSLASKPDLPVLDEAATVDDLIQAVYSIGNGMVISEAPGSVASKQLLIEHMGRLSLEDVDTLYIEHVLSDVHLHKLRKYQQKGARTKSGSHQIKHHLKHVNGGALLNQSATYDYYHLIKKAQQYGIEVKPFNSSVSYNFSNMPVPGTAGDKTIRQMSTFYGSSTISHDIAQMPGRRWVALLDQKIANSWESSPGISELHGAVSVRITDVARDKPLRITRDIDQAGAATPLTRADFNVEMANPHISEVALPSTSAAPRAGQTEKLDRSLAAYLEKTPPVTIHIGPQGLPRVEEAAFVNPYVGEHGFKLDESKQWVRADVTEWRHTREPDAIQQSLMIGEYHIADDATTTLHELIHFERHGLDFFYELGDRRLDPVREKFFNLRTRLQRDARKGILKPTPARPKLPQIDERLAQTELLDRLYEATSGVIIGETHSSVASKKFIIDNMPHLSRQQVKTLYLEHLQSDLHQLDLDYFATTGLMSKRLLRDLKHLDRGHHTDPKGLYNFEQLVIKAREHGLEVRAIDCAVSYNLNRMIDAGPTSRQQMMNFFASKVIRRHQEVVGAHKWLALVGESHANTFQSIVPGIAELEQGISVRIFDVGPGESFGPLPDPGRFGTIDVGSRKVFVKNDFSLGLPTRETPAPLLPDTLVTETPIEVKLYSNGMFLIDESDASHPFLVHRSRSRQIERTPIQVNRRGKLYIDRPSWSSVHLRPFDDLPKLIKALKDMHMTQAL